MMNYAFVIFLIKQKVTLDKIISCSAVAIFCKACYLTGRISMKSFSPALCEQDYVLRLFNNWNTGRSIYFVILSR
jgi:hypothetical protein